MAKLFLSYRRADGVASGARSAIYQRLQNHYGPRSVFMDVERMQVARDFRDSLQEEVSTTNAMLVLIGPDWERLMIERGGEEADFVRIEIEVALALEKPVLPILLGEGTRMPAAESVPESIRPFTFNHGVQLDTGRYFREGIERLIQDMDEHLFAGMPRYRTKPKLSRVAGFAAGVVVLSGIGWYVVDTLKESEQHLQETQHTVDEFSENAGQIESNTAKIARAIEQVGASFEELTKSGGIIENPVAAHEFYHNARMFELRGDYANARKAILGYFQFEEVKLDPHLRYLDFLKVQEGREGTRETYSVIANRTQGFMAKYAAVLLWDRERRIDLLHEFEKAQPQFAPVYYHLSLEYAVDRVGAQSIDDQRQEKAYLQKFREQDQAGELVKYFVDQEMVTAWRDDVEKRLNTLESMAGSLLENPVNLTWMTSNSGWHGYIQIAEPATEIYWKTAEMDAFKRNPDTANIDTRTGKAMPDGGFVMPQKQPSTDISVKYADRNGEMRGPYTIAFEPQAESWASAIRLVNAMPTSWIAYREYNDELLVYFSHLVGYRGALEKIEYGIDTEEPNLDWAFPQWSEPGIAPTGPEVETYRSIPKDTKYMTVRVSFKDGTVSKVVRFER